jgi:hypothetical protein
LTYEAEINGLDHLVCQRDGRGARGFQPLTIAVGGKRLHRCGNNPVRLSFPNPHEAGVGEPT